MIIVKNSKETGIPAMKWQYDVDEKNNI